jgi:hypothetical protein
MKHAQKNLSAGSDVRGGIIRIMNEQGSGVGACRCARLPALFASFRGNSNLSSTIVQKHNRVNFSLSGISVRVRARFEC